MGDALQRHTRRALVATAVTAGLLALPASVVNAGPFCYQTGPGYQKCVDGSTGGYFDPIYQGPKIFNSGAIPWVPTYNPPIAPAPTTAGIDALAGTVLNNIQNTIDADPANAQANIRVLNVSLTQTADTSFEGVATMTAGGGPPRDVPVHVFNAGGTLNWKIDPGAMAVLAQ